MRLDTHMQTNTEAWKCIVFSDLMTNVTIKAEYIEESKF